jgi:hypothetical protein
MKTWVCFTVASALALMPLSSSRAAEATILVQSEESSVQAEARAVNTNAPSPMILSVVLTAATGAWILSGVDWASDVEESSDATLDAPRLSQPESDAVVEPGLVVFRWTAVKRAASYLLDLDVCAETGVCSDFRLERVFGLTHAVEWPAGAPAGRWRVRAVDAENLAGRWSEFRTFSIAAPAMD